MNRGFLTAWRQKRKWKRMSAEERWIYVVDLIKERRLTDQLFRAQMQDVRDRYNADIVLPLGGPEFEEAAGPLLRDAICKQARKTVAARRRPYDQDSER